MRMGSRSTLVAIAALLAGLSVSPVDGWAQLSGGPNTSKPGAVENVPGGSAGGASGASPPALDMPTRSAAPRPADKAPAAVPPLPPEKAPLKDTGKATGK